MLTNAGGEGVRVPRFDYPDDEKKYDWLSMLLDAYHIVDEASQAGIVKEQKVRGQKVACTKGCFHCCINHEIPITEIELAGISWFVSEKLTGNERKTVKKQLLKYGKSGPCPFLTETVCSIYPVRPLACRSFFMFGPPCELNVDPLKTRPGDIWSHGRQVAMKVAERILPFWGITKAKDRLEAFESGFILEVSVPMHTCKWKNLVLTMERFE